MFDLGLLTRARNKYHRTLSTALCTRPFAFSLSVPLISFSFDDFPRSALHVGGTILRRFGARGTYYTSLSLMGKESPTGTMFTREDLKAALALGHELGCHTYDHCDAGTTSPELFERSVIENQRVLQQLLPGACFKTLSYPISQPRPRTKSRIQQHFACCRGGGQTLNAGRMDRNCLRAHFLEQSINDPAAIRELIEENRKARGWLIFVTHDISAHPTNWGCTPQFFEGIVRWAVDSGAKMFPVHEAWTELLHSQEKHFERRVIG